MEEEKARDRVLHVPSFVLLSCCWVINYPRNLFNHPQWRLQLILYETLVEEMYYNGLAGSGTISSGRFFDQFSSEIRPKLRVLQKINMELCNTKFKSSILHNVWVFSGYSKSSPYLHCCVSSGPSHFHLLAQSNTSPIPGHGQNVSNQVGLHLFQ